MMNTHLDQEQAHYICCTGHTCCHPGEGRDPFGSHADHYKPLVHKDVLVMRMGPGLRRDDSGDCVTRKMATCDQRALKGRGEKRPPVL